MDVKLSFTGTDDLRSAVMRHLQNATQEILIALFLLDLPEMAEAVADAKNRGLRVICLLDKKSCTTGAPVLSLLSRAGVPVRIFTGIDSIFHHKIVIIDRKTVLTASLNWSEVHFSASFDHLLELTDPGIVDEARRWFLDTYENGAFFYDLDIVFDSDRGRYLPPGSPRRRRKPVVVMLAAASLLLNLVMLWQVLRLL